MTVEPEFGPPSHPAPEVDVSVLVVTYNAPEWVQRCLSSLVEGSTRRTTEVVVVDNASGEATQRVLDAFADRVQVIRLHENVGFGRACNLAAEGAHGRFILLLNPDTEVQEGAIDALVDHFEAHPEAGIVGGRTLREDGSTDPRSCWGKPTLYSAILQASGLSAVFHHTRAFDPESLGSWDRSSSREVDIVTGCLLLTSRSIWDQLGGFDPTFFMYGEDADLCLRARRLGYRPRITPEAAVVHAVGASSAGSLNKQRLLYRGRCTVLRRHLPRWQVPLAITAVQVGVWVRKQMLTLLGRSQSAVYEELWRERGTWSAGWDS